MKPIEKVEIFDEKQIVENERSEYECKACNSWNISSIVYEKPVNKFVVCSGAYSIQIFDLNPIKELHHTKLSKSFNDIMKLDERRFLVCYEKIITELSIEPPYEFDTPDFISDVSVFRLEKLDDKLIIAQCSPSSLLLIDWAKKEVFKKIFPGKISYNPTLRHSKKYMNSMYINLNNTKRSIRLFDWKKFMISKEFVPSKEKEERISSIHIFENSRREEILIAFSGVGCIYFYNTTEPKYTKEINMENDPDEDSGGGGYGNNVIVSSLCVNNQFLFCGTDQGSFHMYEIHEQENDKYKLKQLIFLKEPKRFDSTEIFVQFHSRLGEELNLMLFERKIHLVKLSGLRFNKDRFDEEVQDLQERVLFLKEEKEIFLFNEEEERKCFFDVVVGLGKMKIPSFRVLFL